MDLQLFYRWQLTLYKQSDGILNGCLSLCKFHSKHSGKGLCYLRRTQSGYGFRAVWEALHFLGVTMKFLNCEVWINL